MSGYTVVSNFVGKGKSKQLKTLVHDTGILLGDRLKTHIKAGVREHIPRGGKQRVYYVKFEKGGELHRLFTGKISTVLKELQEFHHRVRFYE